MAPIEADAAFDRVQQTARLVVKSGVTPAHLKALSKHDEAKVDDATNRLRQRHYVDFINNVRKHCSLSMQFVALITLQPSLLLHMSSGNKKELLGCLSDDQKQNTSPFNSPKLLSFAKKYVPQSK